MFILVLVEFFLEFLFIPDFVVIVAVWCTHVGIRPEAVRFWERAFLHLCDEFVACGAAGAVWEAVCGFVVDDYVYHEFVLFVCGVGFVCMNNIGNYFQMLKSFV